MLSTRTFPLKSFGPALDEFWRSLDVQGHVAPRRADGKRRSGSESSTRLSCATRLYVVVHQNPAHTVPHEISIPAPTMLPECNECRGVRFSFKRVLPKEIGEGEFFGSDEPKVWIARLRSGAEEIRRWAAKSRAFLIESELFLSEFRKTREP